MPHDIIDNRDEKLVEHIKNILGSTDSARFAVGYFMEGSTKTQDGQILPSAGWIDCKEGYYEFWNEVDPANYTSSEEIMGALNTMVREFCGGHSIDYRDSPYYKKGGNAFYL